MKPKIILEIRMAPPEKQKTENYIKNLIDTHSAMLFRICYCILCSKDDAEDALQDTFLKYLTKAPEFESEEKEKAWLVKVAANTSKNMLMFKIRRSFVPLEETGEIGIEDKDMQTLEIIMSLPSKYKLVMTLYYVEGYRVKEISEIVGASEEAVRKRLQKGRELLRKEFERS